MSISKGTYRKGQSRRKDVVKSQVFGCGNECGRKKGGSRRMLL